MKPRRHAPIWIGMALAAGFAVFFSRPGEEPDGHDAADAEVVPQASLPPPQALRAERPALRRPRADEVASVPPHPNAVAFGSPAIPPEREPAVLLGFFELYRQRFGAFPAGEDNAQFMNALCGANAERLAIFPPGHGRFDGDGALLDAWGQPFRFHGVSRQRLEIHSAGPDGEWFTEDDLHVPAGVPSR